MSTGEQVPSRLLRNEADCRLLNRSRGRFVVGVVDDIVVVVVPCHRNLKSLVVFDVMRRFFICDLLNRAINENTAISQEISSE